MRERNSPNTERKCKNKEYVIKFVVAAFKIFTYDRRCSYHDLPISHANCFSMIDTLKRYKN